MQLKFNYSKKSLEFIERCIDQNSRYAEATQLFEWFVSRKKDIGDPIILAPIVKRRFPVKLGNGLRELHFHYINQGDEIGIYHVEFGD